MMTQPHPFLALVEKIYTAANAPTFAQSYRMAVQLAEQDGIEIMSQSRARRAFLLSDAVARHRTEVRGFMQTFFSPEKVEALRVERRHRNLERAKEVLKIVQEVQLSGLPCSDDHAFDAVAERLSVLLFGQA